MKWKEIMTDYFTFTRRERIGILTILLLAVLLIAVPAIFKPGNAEKPDKPDTSWIAAVKKLESSENSAEKSGYENNENSFYQYDPSKTNHYNKPSAKLFYFDPNSISREDWQKLGLREKTINTIDNFRNKGGRFKNPEDLQKVYGLRKSEYDRLAPFVKIAAPPGKQNTETFTGTNGSNDNAVVVKRSRADLLVDVNSADTSAFIALPGIGGKLAARIINFRDKLGGFYTIEQIGETFGLPDSTFQKIKKNLVLKNTAIKKININTAATDDLKFHPYIKAYIANALITYRKEHGPFSSIEDIQKIMIITPETYRKMSPYLFVQ